MLLKLVKQYGLWYEADKPGKLNLINIYDMLLRCSASSKIPVGRTRSLEGNVNHINIKPFQCCPLKSTTPDNLRFD